MSEVAPEIVLLDCESFPNEGYTWGKWEQNVIAFSRPRMICSVAWQFYPSKEVFVKALPDFKGYNPNKRENKALMGFIKKEILEKCDIAIGHNIDDFDDPMFNTDILKNNIGRHIPHKTIDTLKVLKKNFRLNSNKLNDACEELGIGKKVPHPGFQMWLDCMSGDAEAWKLMKRYNMGDVSPLLRGLYERLLPWVGNHPNMTVFDKLSGCPRCRSTHMIKRGYGISGGKSYDRYSCVDCGGPAKGVKVKGKLKFTAS